MTKEAKAKIDRRKFLRALGAGTGVAATPAALVTAAKADSESNDDKRKARYQPDSNDVKAFYRVNRYPG